MPSLLVPINHTIGQLEALKRIKIFAHNIHKQYSGQISDYKVDWNANQATFQFIVSGVTINGILTVNNDIIIIKSKIPILFYPLKGKIEKAIRDKAKSIFA